MAASGDITVAQDGGQGNVKLHPYLITLVRWCVSCLWSTATVLLHRLMITPLQPIKGPKPPSAPKKIPSRGAGSAHLHPEPKVECQLLHQPEHHGLDVIFVHGLYGSLGNTWRQGDWRHKYTKDPQKVTLRNHSAPNTCNCHQTTYNIYNENKCDDITDLNDPDMSMKKINEKLSKKVIPQENDLITEQFYNNTLLDQIEIVDNYETQAKFVKDLFKKDCDTIAEPNNRRDNETNNGYKCNLSDNDNKCNYKSDNDNKCNFKSDNENICNNKTNDNDTKCKYNEVNEFECRCNYNDKKCEAGCGCICNECYSACWPKDWIKMDFPDARVISINYTSDPYLWRPLWIKENKRLNLYQRAEQMIEQLLDMGVGEKPIIWVGHSKGGLFIKQIYCEAYDAYMKINKSSQNTDEIKQTRSEKIELNNETESNGITAANIDTIIEHFTHDTEETESSRKSDNWIRNNNNHTRYNDNYAEKSDNLTRNNDNYTRNNDNYTVHNDNYTRNNDNYTVNNDNYTRKDTYVLKNNASIMNETAKYRNDFEQINIAKNECANTNNLEYVNVINDNKSNVNDFNENGIYENMIKTKYLKNGSGYKAGTSNIEGECISRVGSLWSSSAGFMFYSVPHRGSPLADIKTPVTARSVDLREIAKDCPLVVDLQDRWLRATHVAGAPRVSARSFVETCRTLMSVLWLRIVSTESADAGIGTLSGISVDHREICKPSSRTCLLYTELVDLIQEALRCKCQ